LFDFLLILILAILGFLSHVAKKHRWLEIVLRGFIVLIVLLEGFSVFSTSAELFFNPWVSSVLGTAAVASIVILFIHFRRGLSWAFTLLNLFVTGQIFLPLIRKKLKPLEYFSQNKIFVPSSIPHLVSSFIYISTVAYLLICIDPEGFKMPFMPLPIPLVLAQLLSYNGLGLIILSFCGIGIYISRNYKEALARLALVKPTKAQIGIGIALIIISFTYDALWAVYTHKLGGQDLATKLSFYNSGTFAVAGGFVPSVILALATALCAGIGEETLIRGALQPVFGILPAAILHGMLHGQFAHAPIFILQVAIWSTFMGLVKRYTNTTTTIIGHAGFNFVTTFLFSFNP
jgi:hypothetical protein